jgi:hypothetical protein
MATLIEGEDMKAPWKCRQVAVERMVRVREAVQEDHRDTLW